MNIEKLNITGFGKLISKEVQLKDGINIIYAPNESGKSTLASFLRFMLYGFSKKERASEKNPVTSKQKFIPWEGQQAGGSITLKTNGKSYSIQRTAKKTTQLFSVYDSLTGEQEVFHKEPGEEFFGISLETFESTAFFGQSAFSGLEMDELEAKLRNMATGADEEVSYEKAVTKLKNLHNKIAGFRAGSRSKMSVLNGRKALLESKKEELNEVLAGSKSENTQLKKNNLEKISRDIEQKKAQIEEFQKLNSEKYRFAGEALENKLKEEKDKLYQAELGLTDLTKEEVNSVTIEYYRCNAELAKYKEEPEKPKKSISGIFLIIFAVIIAACGVLLYFNNMQWLMLFCEMIALALLTGGIASTALSSQKYLMKQAVYENEMSKYSSLNSQMESVREFLGKYGLAGKETGEGLTTLANLVEKRDSLNASVEEISKAIELRKIEGEKQFDERLTALNNELHEMENEYNSLRISIAEDKAELVKIVAAKEELAKTDGELGDIELGLQQCKEDADAVALAMNSLDTAHTELTRLFAPALNRAASEYMKLFSGNERTLTIDSKGNVKVCENGVIRPLNYYSAGTIDAVYVAVRLALIDLLYNDNRPPLVFDDTFANFDEKRMAQMMDILSKQPSQIIYLTCRDPRQFLNNIPFNMVEF